MENEDKVIGVIGYGYVGQAVDYFFSDLYETVVYDKFKKELNPILDDLETVVGKSDVIFVCVPTPMKSDGSCYTGIVENVFDDIVAMANSLKRNTDEFIVVVKSTITPGFTISQIERTGLRIVFSPEFLTEKNSVDDFENTNRIVLGGIPDDTNPLAKMFERKFDKKYGKSYPHQIFVVTCTAGEAEMVKLFANALLMTKVLFANEMYLICEKLGVNYSHVKDIACLDPRISNSHLNVPGHDGDLGAGGHCFPKDINSLRMVAQRLGIKEKIFSAVIQRNDDIRSNRDWEKMKGRAIITEDDINALEEKKL